MDRGDQATEPSGEGEKEVKKLTTRPGRAAFIEYHNGTPMWHCPLWHKEDGGLNRSCTSKTQPTDASISTHLNNFHRNLVAGSDDSAYKHRMDPSQAITACTASGDCSGPWKNFNSYLTHHRRNHNFTGSQTALKKALSLQAKKNNDYTSSFYNFEETKRVSARRRTNGGTGSAVIEELEDIIEHIAECCQE